MNVPKGFINSIYVPGGVYEGELAQPCICGYETKLEDDIPLYLITLPDGGLIFCHPQCVGEFPDARL